MIAEIFLAIALSISIAFLLCVAAIMVPATGSIVMGIVLVLVAAFIFGMLFELVSGERDEDND